ncbi:SigB/SigF/SigG family RNA polymerase sigma factor [Pseudonocardia sp. Cha107L01]|uniref:SigB/SigF/SigG family RNA polymerase sigma factor n=1 Tax=Pseudonocardia sp. Cha107L01 TaxID=3457576 RepID=UPI00403E4C2A
MIEAKPRTDEYAAFAPLFLRLAALPPDDPEQAVLRDKLVMAHLPVVRNIARRFVGRGEPADDLEQAGTIGLLGSIDRFDPSRGSEFLAFAIPTITGEIRRHFRDRSWAMHVPRRLKDMQAPIRAESEALLNEMGRAPRPSDLASRLQVPVESVLAALEAGQTYRNGSLEDVMTSDDQPLVERLGFVDGALERVEYHEALVPLLRKLPDRERTILMLRFFGNMTQSQIAARIGISQMHVSRLLSQTLAHLRDRILVED